MKNYTSNDFVDVELYEQRLNLTGELYMSIEEVGLYSQRQAVRASTLQRLCLQYMNLHSFHGYSSLHSSSVLHFLQTVEKVPKSMFRKKGVASESLDVKKILIPMMDNNFAVDFLKLYIEHQECASRRNNMASFYSRVHTGKKVRGWEEVLTAIPFTANRNINLRYNYSNENVISLPKEISNTIKAPDGYVLAWGDFAQSDARIAYNTLLKDETNIRYISEFPDDIYAGFANWVSHFCLNELKENLKKANENFVQTKKQMLEKKIEEDFNYRVAKEDLDFYAAKHSAALNEDDNTSKDFSKIRLQYDKLCNVLAEAEKRFEEDKQKALACSVSEDNRIKKARKDIEAFQPFRGFKNKTERDLYKVYVLQTIYGTRRHVVSEANRFIGLLGKVLDSCPNYKRYWEDIKRRASYGMPIRVHCYMGHVEQVAAFDGIRLKETLFKCLNYPVQGGTSEIMITTTNGILNTFYSLGYTDKDIRVYYIRHDEPIFIFKKSVMKDSWVFKDYSIIHMDDWIPLILDFSFGRVYSNQDRDLTNEFELSTRINEFRISQDLKSTISKDYYPLEPILELAIHIERLSSKRILIVFYLEERNSFDAVTITLASEITDQEVLVRYIEKYLGKLYSLGFRLIVVLNSLIGEEQTFGTIPITRRYQISSSLSVFRAYVIAMAAKSKFEDVASSIVEENSSFLKSLFKLGLFGGDQNGNTKAD